MKDKGIVLSTKSKRARVQVNCLAGCHDCSAQAFCIGKTQQEGIITVDNQANARPGDTVTIEIPIRRYTSSLTLLFGGLLLASLSGLFLGYALSCFFLWAKTETSLAGLVIGVAVGIFSLSVYFKKENKKHLYPSISHILTKGDQHGKA
jgi:positive regulator of sigma E activity